MRVLYGIDDAKDKAHKTISNSVNSNEAINLNGLMSNVIEQFDNERPSDLSKRIMSYSCFYLQFKFWKTCIQLYCAFLSKEFGKVFGWTSVAGQTDEVNILLGEVGMTA